MFNKVLQNNKKNMCTILYILLVANMLVNATNIKLCIRYQHFGFMPSEYSDMPWQWLSLIVVLLSTRWVARKVPFSMYPVKTLWMSIMLWVIAGHKLFGLSYMVFFIFRQLLRLLTEVHLWHHHTLSSCHWRTIVQYINNKRWHRYFRFVFK